MPRLIGTGVLLPTATTATIVLTTTGAHLGAAPAPVSPLPVVAATTEQVPGGPSEPTAQQGVLEAKTRLLALQRPTAERAARSSTRTSPPPAAQVTARARAATAAKAATALATAHRWVTPVDVRFTLTSGFGMRWGTMHAGQDFALPVGSPVKSMSSGTVIFAGWSGGYGNKVEIRYWDGTISWYAHNSRLTVRTGDAVTPGEVVASSGNTGHSTGPHAHIEIHLRSDNTPASAVSPVPWLTAHGNMPGHRSSTGPTTATD